MALIEVINISHSFGDKVLYENSSFELFKGEHMGLVGQNGTGKSTLLNSIYGTIIPDKGEIRVQKNIKIGYLDQYANIDLGQTVFAYLKTAFSNLYETDEKLTALYESMAEDMSEETMQLVSQYQSVLTQNGFYEIEATILKVADGLGITAIGMDTTLDRVSGGQRARIILAKLLLEQPDLLLLDEPTNFLDKEHVDWLIGFLQTFKGAFILISHDFDFLDKVTDCICDIEFYKIQKYHGNFAKFLELKGRKRESYIREYKSQQRQIAKLEDYIARNKVRASTAAMAQSRQKQLDKIERLPPPETPPKPNFRFQSLPISSDLTLKVKELSIGYYYPLLPNLNFDITPGQKIAITGFNGIGKSTLLKTLVGQIPSLGGSFRFSETTKYAYFEQELVWEDDQLTPIEIVVSRYPKLSNSQARKYLYQCGVGSKHALQSISTLSGGEQSKVKLCLLMLTKANLLILDEPTNHLDVDTKEVLKRELLRWEGSLILVSHEAAFYQDLVDKVIQIKN